MCLPKHLRVCISMYLNVFILGLACMTSQLVEVQEAANSWTFSIFDLADATSRPLSTLAFFLLKVCHTLQTTQEGAWSKYWG